MRFAAAFTLKTATAEYTFSPVTGGFPSVASVIESDGKKFDAWNLSASPFSIRQGKTLFHPVCDKDTPVNRFSCDGAKVVEFPRISWKDEKGEVLKDFYLCLKWEFFPDGAVFCDLFVFYATLDAEIIQDFKLSIPVILKDFDDVKWSVRLHPEKVDATIIQAAPPERFLPLDASRSFDGKLFAQTNFNAMRKKGPSFFAEFLMEGNNSLFNYTLEDTASSVNRTEDGFLVEWNFQKNPAGGRSFPPLHWRNRLALLLRPAGIKRNLPPMGIIHFIDNASHYPTVSQIKAFAQAGTKILILHEWWRFDVQNGGIPFDEKKFRNTVRLAHKYGIRVAPYIRGNEISAREDAASWFDARLIKNFDGLYMDYGGPFGYAYAPDENFPGGRIAFREYYKSMRALRERVGKDGVFFSHTGTGYSGIASSFFTGFVSGEGERGILVRGRREHEYFTMSAVSPGSMWTAAFPEYSSLRMTPFLAAAVQIPHQPIGIQADSSSLRHPPVPGLHDEAFRELLYIWSLLGGGDKTSFEYYTDYNCRNVFTKNDPMETAHTLILAPGKKYGIMTLANCSGKEMEVKASFKLNGNFSKYKFFAVPGQKDPAKVKKLAPHEVVGCIVAFDKETAEKVLKKYPRSVLYSGKEVKEHLALVDEQRSYRLSAVPSKKNLFTVHIPMRILSHEKSLLEDLYDLVFALQEVKKDGTVKEYGYLSKKGLVKEIPPAEESLKPGDYAAKMDLSRILGKGEHDIRIYSTNKGIPFYSYFIADVEWDEGVKKVMFMNEVESVRSFLSWHVSVK